MNRSRTWGRAVALLLVVGAMAARGVENRFSDVFYLDEAGLKLIPLKTLRRVPLTFSRDQSTILAPMVAGQRVWLVGYAEKRFYVSSLIRTGVVRGWVDVDALEPLSLEQRAELDHKREMLRTQKAAIARHEVLIGMTQAQVQAALGNASERARSTTAESEEEVWSYITYRREPYTQTFLINGHYVTETRYRKVPTGGKHISFRNGLVAGIREAENTAQAEPPAAITTVPVLIAPSGPHRPGSGPWKPPGSIGKPPSPPGKHGQTPQATQQGKGSSQSGNP